MKRTNFSSREKSLRDIFAIPLVLAALNVVGLLAALIGEGDVSRVLSWVALAAPIGVIIRHAAFGRNSRRRVE